MNRQPLFLERSNSKEYFSDQKNYRNSTSKIKYNSFVLSLFIFYPISITSSIILELPQLSPQFIFPALFLPLLLSINHFARAGGWLAGLLVAYVAFCFLASSPSWPAANHVIVLTASFALPAIIVASVPLSMRNIENYCKWLAHVNLILLAFIAIIKPEIYLDRDLVNYMSFGYWVLISYVFYVDRYVRRGDWLYLILAILSLVLIVGFGSRFATISAIISALAIYSFRKGFGWKSATAAVLLGAVCIFAIANIAWLLKGLIPLFEQLGASPTNLYRLSSILDRESDASSSARWELYQTGLNLIGEWPLGYGIFGYAEYLIEDRVTVFRYPHNIFIQLLLEFGLLFGVGILILTIELFRKVIACAPRNIAGFVLLLLCISMKLLVTGSYLWEPAIWIALVLGARALPVLPRRAVNSDRNRQLMAEGLPRAAPASTDRS